jgi:threonine dehydrogenase-like Zn-dependent dehydrogenase
VGTVVENPGGGGPKAGDRVAINIISGCGRCTYCLKGDRRFCDEQGYVMNSHAEYVAVPDYCCMPLPDDIPFDIGALLGGDTIGVAYHTFNKVKPKPRDTVVVVGVGPIGSGFVAMLNYLGLRTIVVEISPYRRELVKGYGVEHVIDPTQTDALAAIRELTGGKGADVAVDATGKDAGVNLALNATCKEGTFIFAGAGHEASINPWEQFLEKEIVAYGVWYFVDADYFGILDAYRQGLSVDGLLTHRFHLEEAQAAYDLFSTAQSGKVVFVPKE